MGIGDVDAVTNYVAVDSVVHRLDEFYDMNSMKSLPCL